MNLDMDKIVDLLRAGGITAYVEQTGGGCATIYAGESYVDSHGDERYPVLAGPGWFEGPNWTIARGDTDDFSVGLDDDGETPSDITDTEATEEVVAQTIREMLP